MANEQLQRTALQLSIVRDVVAIMAATFTMVLAGTTVCFLIYRFEYVDRPTARALERATLQPGSPAPPAAPKVTVVAPGAKELNDRIKKTEDEVRVLSAKLSRLEHARRGSVGETATGKVPMVSQIAPDAGTGSDKSGIVQLSTTPTIAPADPNDPNPQLPVRRTPK